MLKDLFKGISSYFLAFGLLNKLKLWKYFAIPILISFLTGVILIILAFFLAEDLGNFIALAWPFDWGKETVSTISHIMGGLLIAALGLILFKHLVMAFSAPFMGPVSEKIEHHLLENFPKEKEHNTNFSTLLARGIRINIRNLIRELLFVLPLFILSFMFPIIAIVFSVLIFLVQGYYAGFGNMDYTLERHFKYKDSIKFVQKNRGIAIGNGVGFMLILLIPVVGVFIVLPLSVVAATKNTVEKIHLIQ